jgi:exodeoxyribonuclease VII small subunit
MSKDQEISFEKALGRLQEIVEKLEEGQAPLDQSLELFEEGVRLSRLCHGTLDKIEGKIEIISDQKGKTETAPFELEN